MLVWSHIWLCHILLPRFRCRGPHPRGEQAKRTTRAKRANRKGASRRVLASQSPSRPASDPHLPTCSSSSSSSSSTAPSWSDAGSNLTRPHAANTTATSTMHGWGAGPHYDYLVPRPAIATRNGFRGGFAGRPAGCTAPHPKLLEKDWSQSGEMADPVSSRSPSEPLPHRRLASLAPSRSTRVVVVCRLDKLKHLP